MFARLSRPEIARHIGFILIVALLIFSPLLEGGTTHLAAMIIRLLILSALFAYVVHMAGTRTLLLPRMAIGIPVLVFLGLMVVSTKFSPYTNQSEQWLIVCVGYAGLLYLLAVFVRQWEQWTVLQAVLVLMALFEAGVTFFQYYEGRTERPSGTFFNPNFLAGYLAAIFVLVLAAVCYSKVWHRRAWSTWQTAMQNGFPFIVLLVLGMAIALTGSRGGTLALIAGTSVVIGARIGCRGMVGLSILLAVVAVTPNPIHDRALAEHRQNPVAYARWQMWQGAVQEIVEHPLGAGVGLYQYVYPRHAVSIDTQLYRYGKTAQNTHNEYLQIGVELGIVGLGVFLWGIALLGREAIALLRQRLTRRQRALALGACAGIVVILTQATLDSNLREPAIAILLICCTGIVTLGRTLGEKEGLPRHRSLTIQAPGLWVTVGIIGLIVLGTHVLKLGAAYQLHEDGTSLVKQRQLEQAIDSFQSAIRLDPGKSLYHSSLAGTYFQIYQRTHDPRMAHASLEELNTAIALNPLDGRLRNLLGHVLVSQASLDQSGEGGAQRHRLIQQAREAYEQAVKIEPFVYVHRIELANVMLWLGQRGDAERCFREVIELEPNFLPARAALARLSVESGKKGRAEEEYKEIVARQRQFGAGVTNQLERDFLQVDVAGLEALLTGKPSST